MKISYNWLKEYIKTDLGYNQLSEILTNIGLEVESIEHFQSVKGGLEGLVIGEIKEVSKHPDADRLSLTKVDVGTGELLPIVCGAPNVEKGQKVVVATIGTTLYSGNEEFKIKKGKIRGAESHGMICAEDEIGLGSSHEGIMILDNNANIGTLAKEFFGIADDIIFEIGLTPNRIDGASHIGVARDLSAYLSQKEKISYTKPSVDNFKIDNNSNFIDVEIQNKEACHRYAGITVSNIEVKESPKWLKNRLKAIGQKPINNIVDITNFVLHETGQPLHAFDADMIAGKKVIVKTLDEGTTFKTLDEQHRKLASTDLMICNKNEGMCIAGVFGGADSGVSDKTKNIFIESAYFNPVFVRKTSKKHILQTDSSFRFERGVDPNNIIYALKRAALLVKEIAGGQISSEIVDVYPNPVKDFEIELSYLNIDRLIGKKIEHQQIKNILAALEIKIISENGDNLSAAVPPFRVDVTREADIIEEILRIYGYNNVEISTNVKSTISYAPKPDKNKWKNIISDLLSNKTFNEAMSNSLTKAEYFENLESFKAENSVKILNPLSSDLNVLRQSLLFGGLEAVSYNENRKISNIKIYEFGKCYFYKTSNDVSNPLNKYSEEEHLALFISGNKNIGNWNEKEVVSDFYEIKSYAEIVLTRLGYNIEFFKQNEISNDIFEFALEYSLNNKVLAQFGMINKKLLKKFDISKEVYYADIQWDNLFINLPDTKSFQTISKFPEVKRDLALLVDKSIKFSQIKELAFKNEKKLLKQVSIFDIYEGEKLGANKKSYAINFILQDKYKTLNDKQIDKIMNNFISVFEKELEAKLR
ncbi:MAG: phenylalanine--tRNA ligase subunit beta [Bacteroidales bacterium]|nr:phenylalanine--tRNA ligase subunit beta [Bacteroidales bacterium]MBN2755990.1 phenylalanine--tRNA ligase subunit beta [Bacteroidales bacterium]